MTTGEPADSAVRHRTRQAIVQAAIAVWSRDFSVSLVEIADRAAVSRSTLHRYFTDRSALVTAGFETAVESLEREGERAVAGVGTAIGKLEALMRTSIDLGDEIIFLFADPGRFTDQPGWGEDALDEGLLGLVAEAQAAGDLAADVEHSWIIGMYYSTVYVAAESIASGEIGRHRAGDIAVRTFLRGLGAGSS